MIPLVGEVKELKYVKDASYPTADKLIADAGARHEVPSRHHDRDPACRLTADEIAKEADFFCFGTNDLTQMTFGFSRDDAGKFLTLTMIPRSMRTIRSQHLDQIGVGKLVKMAADDGRATSPNIELGICGEHGGDPTSVEFCHNVWPGLRFLLSVPRAHRTSGRCSGCY